MQTFACLALMIVSLPVVAQNSNTAPDPTIFKSLSIARAADASRSGVIIDDVLWSHMTTVRGMIAVAHDLPVSRIKGGPDWIDQRLYDIKVQLHPDVSSEKHIHRKVAAILLETRFGLKVHKDFQVGEVQVLTVGDRAKFDRLESAQSSERFRVSEEYKTVVGRSTSTEELISILQMQLRSTVIDRTNESRRFNFKLTNASLTAESLPRSLEDQLGLKLELRSMPLEVLVVDAIHHPASVTWADSPTPCRELARARFDSLMTQTLAQQVYHSGEFVGLRVYPARDREAFNRTGFKPADLLVAFCGVDLPKLRVNDKRHCCLASADAPVTVTVVRDDTQMTFVLPTPESE